eukprot:10430375-Alexandrium_andersonii.AAC.1
MLSRGILPPAQPAATAAAQHLCHPSRPKGEHRGRSTSDDGTACHCFQDLYRCRLTPQERC